jgi:BirA family transcriptional regulator, biotin operon repressor / biotin---[acetyl-CoA-carboxylase] ligase
MGDPPATRDVRWRIRRFEDIDSTNRYALDAARAGEAPGLVVVADHQRAGRGRRGRTWTAPPGTSLLVSVLLAPPTRTGDAHVLTMASALALQAAVSEVAGVHAALKWPNDLVVHGLKLAGLLAEADVYAGTVRHVVVGIGCNVGWVDVPPELADTATSCAREAGRDVDRSALLDALLRRLGARLDALDGVPGDYRRQLSTIGRAVRVELVDAAVEGVATDVDAAGRLVVQPASGDPVVVAVGDVVHLRPLTGRGSTPPAR